MTDQRRTGGRLTPKTGSGRPVTSTERKQMARLRVAGATRDQICEATGRCHEAVSAALKHPETVSLMRRLADQYDDRLAALYGKVLEAVEQDLKSETVYLRAGAEDRALKLIELADKARGLLAQAPAEAQPQQGQYTLTELLLVLRQQTQNGGEGDGNG